MKLTLLLLLTLIPYSAMAQTIKSMKVRGNGKVEADAITTILN